MKKINLANVEEFKEYENPTAGGYVCGIYAVEDVPEKEYLKLSYDIIEGEFKGYYQKLVKDGVFKALPNFISSYSEKSLPFFKGTITSIEKSNNGFKFTNDESKLKGKKIGLVLFEEEYINKKGEVKVSLRVDKAHSVEAIKTDDFKVPERKSVAQTTSTSAFGAFGSKASTDTQEDPFTKDDSGFENIPDSIDKELPFGNDEEPFPFD